MKNFQKPDLGEFYRARFARQEQKNIAEMKRRPENLRPLRYSQARDLIRGARWFCWRFCTTDAQMDARHLNYSLYFKWSQASTKLMAYAINRQYLKEKYYERVANPDKLLFSIISRLRCFKGYPNQFFVYPDQRNFCRAYFRHHSGFFISVIRRISFESFISSHGNAPIFEHIRRVKDKHFRCACGKNRNEDLEYLDKDAQNLLRDGYVYKRPLKFSQIGHQFRSEIIHHIERNHGLQLFKKVFAEEGYGFLCSRQTA